MITYHTVKTSNPMPPKPTRTVADYRAELQARFGRVPSYQELARMERGDSIAQRPYVAQPAKPTPRLIAQKAAQAAKAAATRQSILDALVKPMTAKDVAHAIKREEHLVRRYLVLMAAEGAVMGSKVKQVTVWTPTP